MRAHICDRQVYRNKLEDIERTLRSWEGDIGGVSVAELFRGPLLCDNLPDVLGDTSCIHKTKVNHYFLVVNIKHFNYKFKLSTPLTIKKTPLILRHQFNIILQETWRCQYKKH